MKSNQTLHIVTGNKPPASKQVNGEYLPALADGLRVDTILDFDLYIRQHDNRYVLYRNKNLTFTRENAERLKATEVGCVCISAKDREKYLSYIENQLPQIVRDSSIPAKRKTTLLYKAAANTIRQVITKPLTSAGLERAMSIADNVTEHLATNPGAFEDILRTSPSEYSTETHSINVCAYSLAIANSMGKFGHEEMRALGTGALLHDIGKYKIDEDIINKREPLSTHEWEELKKHPEYGLKMLERFEELPPGTLPVVMLHHEKVNGSGYPAGLKGNDIPLAARIACIADIFDAITSDRAYKGAVSSYEALIKMSDEMQGLIDSEVFAHFLRLLQF